jgi:spore germination cell wall hydrolase CwlJ-like protein
MARVHHHTPNHNPGYIHTRNISQDAFNVVLRNIPDDTIIPSIRRMPPADRDQTLCLALAIYHEARGDMMDRIPVAQVIYNRIAQKPATVCATIWALGGTQFPWVRHRGIIPRERAAWQNVQADAVAFLTDRPSDNTQGANFFFNPLLCHPRWARAGRVTLRLHHTYVRIDRNNQVISRSIIHKFAIRRRHQSTTALK